MTNPKLKTYRFTIRLKGTKKQLGKGGFIHAKNIKDAKSELAWDIKEHNDGFASPLKKERNAQLSIRSLKLLKRNGTYKYEMYVPKKTKKR